VKKVGFFIGFLSEAETQRDNQSDEVLKLLKELDRRNSRRDVLFFVVGIVIGVIANIAIVVITNVAPHLLGH